MITAGLISVGNELIRGLFVDTNVGFLARRLQSLGVIPRWHWTVGDSLDDIAAVIRHACAVADLVIVTGGLGPTADDQTRFAIAEVLGVPLEPSAGLLAEIEARFRQLGRQMSAINQIQAHLPKGSHALPNRLGTAPGILCQKDGCLVVALPGVPSEMEEMFIRSVEPIIIGMSGRLQVFARRIHCFGLPESEVAQTLGPLMERGRNPLVDCTASYGQVTLYVTAVAEDIQQARSLAEADEAAIRDRLGCAIFGTDDQTLPAVVGMGLSSRGKTLALAESCTGGLVAKLITDQAGSSRYLVGGFVVYSNKGKIEQLGVEPDLLAKKGPVSEEVALAMARGARSRLGCDYVIAITGVAGPEPVGQVPVGTVFVALDGPEGQQVQGSKLFGDRHTIRMRAALMSLNMLRLRLGL
ncbi:MAG: competence/damage-inducible protein A [Sedimentisphaerales bacterium]|nr:competence/damage-inducible protein A [Sedimentisphaerales bacterium]